MLGDEDAVACVRYHIQPGDKLIRRYWKSEFRQQPFDLHRVTGSGLADGDIGHSHSIVPGGLLV